MRTRSFQGFPLTVAAVTTYIFLYTPVCTMIAFSFNDSASTSFPWRGFTLKWYEHSLNNSLAIKAFLNSLKLGAAVAITGTVLALLVALAFRRIFPGKSLLLQILLLPLLVPAIILGVGQAVFWGLIGLKLNLWGSMFLGHLVYVLPFAFIAIYPRVHRFDPNIEAAAMDLGATPWIAFWTIVFPRILPGIIASVLFTFTLSFDEFIRSLFLIGSENTLPLYLWSIILTNPSPETSALATLSVVCSLTVVGIGALISRVLVGRD